MTTENTEIVKITTDEMSRTILEKYRLEKMSKKYLMTILNHRKNMFERSFS